MLEYEAANKIALSILSKYNFDAQPKASINNLFRCLKESPDDAFLLFSQSSINNYTFDVFYKIIEEKALPEWLKKSNISNEQGEIIFYHTIYSIFNLLRLWYNGNVKMCEDDFKELYHDLINYGVYYYIYSK